MIRKTLAQVKAATYAILLPDPGRGGLPTPRGTGFFIDDAGHFLTAHHVVAGQAVDDVWLQQSPTEDGFVPMLQWSEKIAEWPASDLALLKVDFERNSNKAHLKGRRAFPFITVELAPVEEGTPVYAFGYPLPEVSGPMNLAGGLQIAHIGLGHRTTSAIVASTLERTTLVRTSLDPQVYVLDAAPNYGNSGGPIVVSESGKVFAVCSRFQPLQVPQPGGGSVFVPSLYGVVTSISNIAAELASRVAYLGAAKRGGSVS